MNLSRPVQRPASETIIALIDVVFFLLVFAMLSGRMDASAPFELSPPIALTGDELGGGGITLAIGTNGELALDGIQAERTAAVDAIAQRIGRDGRQTLVRINADAETTLRNVLPLVSELEAVGAENVVFVVTPERP